MLKKIIVLAVIMVCGINVLADYVSDRKTAMNLIRGGTNEEALALFKEMAAGKVSDFQKSDALEQAAMCANRLKRYDQAMDLARKIPLAPMSKTCQMQIMNSNRKWKELVEQFKGEDIGSWPDGIQGNAFFVRGGAVYRVGDGKMAESDLKKACEYLYDDNSKGLVLNALGDTYWNFFTNDVLAIESYRRVYTPRNIYKRAQAAIAIAGIFNSQQKYDEALRELNSIDISKMGSGYWCYAMLCALGNVFAKQGKKQEASPNITKH